VAEPVDATELALRALRHRDRSRAELERRLDEAGVEADERGATLDRLTDAGLLSDSRFAAERARTLAVRGAGNLLIRRDLQQHGIELAALDGAIAELESEDERAARVFERRGGGTKAARYLAARGFAAETIERLMQIEASDALE
jgi:regulatory protein